MLCNNSGKLCYISTYLFHFLVHIPKDNLIVAVMSVHWCWDALIGEHRYVRRTSVSMILHQILKLQIFSCTYVQSNERFSQEEAGDDLLLDLG